MSTSPSTRRSSTQERTDLFAQLKDDHKRVKKAYRDFQKLDATKNPDECETLVRQVLDELSVHAALEEELLYPAAMEALTDSHLVEEAMVEHESLHTLIDQLRGMSPEDESYAARFTVLCEYVLHHVKEEEGEMFPQLERARMDWDTLAEGMHKRREELMLEHAGNGDPAQDMASLPSRATSGTAGRVGGTGRASSRQT